MSDHPATDAATLPAFPYGAVYFRKSNPPREDWERDYQTAAQDGFNVFRHWFLWSAIEPAPGVFDWSEYDAQFELAARHGIKTLIGEISHSAPEWVFRDLPACRFQRADGSAVDSRMRNSCATGGFPGLCLDNDAYRALVEQFLTRLVKRYRDHPALGAYDIWNETNTLSSGYTACYCDGTATRFREWLREKYGTPQAVSVAWRKYGFRAWEDILPPSQGGPYLDELDWIQFRLDNAQHWLKWRVDLVRALDPNHPVTAHGVAAAPLYRIAEASDEFWRSAAHVDVYGFTWGGASYGNDAWQQYHVADMVRAGARGKPFWHSEATAGPSWLGGSQQGRPRDDGRIPTAGDVRLWNMTSLASGATGLMYNRWRPLLDGPLFGALAAYDLDGSPTPRSEQAGAIARWANEPAQARLWHARPIRGEVGILYLPESPMFASLSDVGVLDYADAARGAYRGFFHLNLQPDWVQLADIDDYHTLYLPYPLLLADAVVARLTAWVEAGGKLISEGAPGFFNERGRVGATQPNRGLEAVFGAHQVHAEFTPDLLATERILLSTGPQPLAGGYLQLYQPTTGTAVATIADGRIAAVDHTFGAGRTRLIGTSPGLGHARTPEDGQGTAFYADLVRWAGITPVLVVSAPAVTARLHRSATDRFIWLTNPSRKPVTTTVRLHDTALIAGWTAIWGATPEPVTATSFQITLDARDAAVIRVEAGG